MSRLLQLVISGGVSGSVFAIVASGLVLTFSTSGIFNFGHAGIAFATAYLYFELNTGFGWPVWLAAIASVLVFAPLLGFVLDRILFRRLADAPVYARIVGTIGLSVALPNLALWIVEQARLLGADIPDNQQVVTAPGLGPTPPDVWQVPGGAVITSDQLIVLAAAALTAFGFWLVIKHTHLGLHMRADVDRREMAEMRGVNSSAISSIAWMMSTMLAGLAGVCIGPFFGLSDVAFTFVVLGSMGAVVVARFQSLPVALAAGLALGVLSNLVAGYSDELLPGFLAQLSGLRSAVPFLFTFVALLVWGRARTRVAGTAAREAPPQDPLRDMPRWRRWTPWAVATVGLVWYVLLVADDFWAGLVARGLILGIVFLSFTVVTGLGGMISLAQASFVTAGAFVAGWLSTEQGWPFALAVVGAAAVAGVAGALIVLPLRRLGALELALATLALSFVTDLVVFQVESVRNGSSGYTVSPPVLGPLELSNPRVLTVCMLVVFGLVALCVVNLTRSATGRAIFAARSSDAAARSVGLSPDRSKVILFAVSGAIAGAGGALLAISVTPFTNVSTPPLIGLIWLAVVVTWGVRRPAGALIAGLTFVVLGPLLEVLLPAGGVAGDMLTSSRFLPILFGVGAINLAREPDGLLAMGIAQRRAIGRAFRRDEADRSTGPGTSPVGLEPQVPRPVVEVGVALPASNGTGPEPETEVSTGVPVLAVRNVVAGYGEVEVLHTVDLTVGRGEIVALLGPNGAGKSTLCRTVGGLVIPSSGSVEFLDRDITDAPTCTRFRSGMTVAPEGRGIFPGLSVEDNLAVVLDSREDVAAAFSQFPALANRRRQLAGSLSGGEQQLLALAASLVRPPELLVADEPMLGLAPLVSEMIGDVLQQCRAQGTAVLLVDEKLGDALSLADRAVVMNVGRIVWAGLPSELDDETAVSAYFDGGAGSSDPVATASSDASR